MAQKTIEKLNREVSDLKKEVKILRSFLIGSLSKDKEGEYKPEFIKKILRLSKEEGVLRFKNPKDFLKQAKKNS